MCKGGFDVAIVDKVFFLEATFPVTSSVMLFRDKSMVGYEQVRKKGSTDESLRSSNPTC